MFYAGLISEGASVMTNVQMPSERHFRYHRHLMLLYLLLCTVMAVGTVVAVLTPGENSEFALVPEAIVLVFMTALTLVVRGRRGKDHKREMRRIWQDEWLIRCQDRSRRTALLTVILIQVPLMVFMDYVPPEPSVVGMGSMTIAVGCGAFAAGYLYHSRANANE